ncbi:hypothetical protein AB3S75_028032 [Citrus x aurantiifolia]
MASSNINFGEVYSYLNERVEVIYMMAPFSKPSNRMQRRKPQIIGKVSRITCHICQVGSVITSLKSTRQIMTPRAK